MTPTPGDRLRELRVKRYPTAKEAAEAFGWNEVTYRSHESGMRNIPVHTARKYAQAFNSSAGFILGVAGPSQSESPTIGVNLVPLVAKVSAGAFRLDDVIETDYEVASVPRADIPPHLQYAVQVDGPSVNMRIPDGAFAICAPFDKFPGGARHGQLVHVVRERAGMYEHTIKELLYTPAGMVLMPCSRDPRFQKSIDLSAPEDDTVVRIHGVVIGMFQPM